MRNVMTRGCQSGFPRIANQTASRFHAKQVEIESRVASGGGEVTKGHICRDKKYIRPFV